MARVLVIYHRQRYPWLTTYLQSLHSLRKYSDNECLYFNAARPRLPKYLRSFEPDLVVFHYTALLQREVPVEWERILRLIAPVKTFTCPKVLIAQDEQVRMDLLNAFLKDFDVTTVFTPTPPSMIARVYAETDFERVAFHPILTGYLDEASIRRTERRSRQLSRPIDVGYRSWYSRPFYGSHGQLKRKIGYLFRDKAPAYGLKIDISDDLKDAFFGDSWFDFLLSCKYTIGVEGGCSVFDWDGSIAECTRQYGANHPDATYADFEAACFPGLDGEFDYFLMSPRHLEAAMTRTCQILIEGEYAGALRAGEHYIALQRDFGNIEEVLQLMKNDTVRGEMVERAYRDVVASGEYVYGAFVRRLFETAIPAAEAARVAGHSRSALRLIRNRLDDFLWVYWAPEAKSILRKMAESRVKLDHALRRTFRPLVRALLGESMLRRVLAGLRRAKGRDRMQGESTDR